MAYGKFIEIDVRCIINLPRTFPILIIQYTLFFRQQFYYLVFKGVVAMKSAKALQQMGGKTTQLIDEEVQT